MAPSLEAQRSAEKRKKLLPVAIVAAAAVAYGGYWLYLSRQPYEWSGTVETRTISVGSRVGGRVKEVRAKEGQHVEAGEVLLVLEPGDLLAQKMQAEGQLAQAKAALAKLDKGARPEELEQAKARAQAAAAALEESRRGARKEQVAAAEAQLRAATAAADQARLDAERMRKLSSAGAAAPAQVDSAESRLRQANAQRDAAAEALRELKNGVRAEELRQAEARSAEARAGEQLVVAGARSEDIDAARGAVTVAEGRLQAIETAIAELEIKAPRAARVESLDLRPGDLLAPSAIAASLLEDGQLYVRVYVPETQLGHVHVGQSVPVVVDSFPGKSFAGVVESVSGVGEFSPRNLQTADERADQVFATRVGLREGLDVLKAGMAAFVQVPR